ncbi:MULTISPECIES: Crp/Fnr family transcriptional regulator [Flavobacteriaceae]|jgi:CRP/FNR family transcriptional regulator|uniref:Crp/Fnr family transcriptional regulator n=1 Tax=Flavobacteriaceae TaxID=49546 RepID=UPI0004DFAE6A|nr:MULTISPECIES: Crp/Fnr family transcriptional regulator [Flavobacteriaceae]MAG88926.1 Crp/Fnr family transcriptional regulator [Flavobacteriaceae bacterium]MCC4227745.1 Crp/Fnr family transcriptional regulator [Zunongwangia profunda]|tara:strand:+ start:1197 stop:1829 length:633 start_codon:yes stop_codon:yes gene_type:complete
MIEELQKYYGQLFEPELLVEINQTGTFKEVPEGFTLMEIGQFVKGMPLLLSGVVKVLRIDKDGDELLLYFLERGETCAMTLTCCMGQTKSEIRAIAETDTKIIMVPIQKMEEWTSKYKTWREFVFESYHNRLMEVLDTIDSIAFYNMDERLLKYLRDKVKVTKSNIIQNTHQEIAYELHTSRVVVSRLLKKLEKLGIVELSRNSIKVFPE